MKTASMDTTQQPTYTGRETLEGEIASTDTSQGPTWDERWRAKSEDGTALTPLACPPGTKGEAHQEKRDVGVMHPAVSQEDNVQGTVEDGDAQHHLQAGWAQLWHVSMCDYWLLCCSRAQWRMVMPSTTCIETGSCCGICSPCIFAAGASQG